MNAYSTYIAIGAIVLCFWLQFHEPTQRYYAEVKEERGAILMACDMWAYMHIYPIDIVISLYGYFVLNKSFEEL